jgi:hypothetical protein
VPGIKIIEGFLQYVPIVFGVTGISSIHDEVNAANHPP